MSSLPRSINGQGNEEITYNLYIIIQMIRRRYLRTFGNGIIVGDYFYIGTGGTVAPKIRKKFI